MNARIDNIRQDRKWRREFFRRLAYLVVVSIALLLGVLFVRWINRTVGLGRIGEFYKQADELSTPN